MNHYEILGVSFNSSIEEIKKAYHKKAHENHPDKGGDEYLMKLINNAYSELIKLKKVNYKIKPFTQYKDNRPINKCGKCGKDTYYYLCLDCWIEVKREEKKQRIKTVRSFMFCLNCNKSLSNRTLNTIFCDIKCSKEYYKKRGKVKPKKCNHDICLSEEEGYRLKKIGVEKIFNLKYKERIIIFTRLVGKKKAIWFDSIIQEKFNHK